MVELWKTLIPLILASAVLPVQTIITLVLVRTSIRSAFAWVTGMATVRLVQGFLFGVVLTAGEKQAGPTSPRYFTGILLLVLATLLYVKALRKALGADNEDAPPPKWAAKAGSMSPMAAFGAGAGFMTLSVKFLVFTLGAISAITEAHLRADLAALSFLLFVVLAQCAPLAILLLAASSSRRSSEILEGFSAWLRRNNRMITIIFGLFFGTWFLIKALTHLCLI
jgi:threonine/homoserine/homoserine lactone efflux protein